MDQKKTSPYYLLTPRRGGPEITEMDLERRRFTAFTGTGFNEDNPWHRGDMPGDHRFPYGGDGLRYAIAIQQLRDDGDFALADAACTLVKAMRFDVGKAKDRTVVSGERTRTL